MVEKLFGGFWEHVGELAHRMKVVIVTFLVSIIVVLLLPGNADILGTTNNYQPLVSVFLKYVRNMILPPSSNVKLIALSASDPITLYVIAGVMFGIAITMPVFAYQAYKFVDPALYSNEKKAIFPFVAIVSALFTAGAIFGFFFLFPIFIQSILPFFSAVGAELMFSIMDFYSMLFFTIIISGVLFTIPAFFVLLVKFGILKTAMFSRKRKWVYVGFGIAAMLISPGATPQGDLVLFIALGLLFETSMLIGRTFERSPASESTKTFKLFSNPTCIYCNTKLGDSNLNFCPACHKSTK